MRQHLLTIHHNRGKGRSDLALLCNGTARSNLGKTVNCKTTKKHARDRSQPFSGFIN
jgi:hypothetical protein